MDAPPCARPPRGQGPPGPPPRGCVNVCVRAAVRAHANVRVRAALCAHERARAHRHARERVRACCRAHAWRRARACCRVHVRSFLFGIFSLVCSLVSLGTLGVAPMRHGSGRCREGMHPPATFVPGQAGGVAGPGSLVTTSEDVGPPPRMSGHLPRLSPLWQDTERVLGPQNILHRPGPPPHCGVTRGPRTTCASKPGVGGWH